METNWLKKQYKSNQNGHSNKKRKEKAFKKLWNYASNFFSMLMTKLCEISMKWFLICLLSLKYSCTNDSYIYTAQKLKFSIKDFFSKCDQIGRKLRIWSHLLKKSLMENFIFCVVLHIIRSTVVLTVAGQGGRNSFRKISVKPNYVEKLKLYFKRSWGKSSENLDFVWVLTSPEFSFLLPIWLLRKFSG